MAFNILISTPDDNNATVTLNYDLLANNRYDQKIFFERLITLTKSYKILLINITFDSTNSNIGIAIDESKYHSSIEVISKFINFRKNIDFLLEFFKDKQSKKTIVFNYEIIKNIYHNNNTKKGNKIKTFQNFEDLINVFISFYCCNFKFNIKGITCHYTYGQSLIFAHRHSLLLKVDLNDNPFEFYKIAKPVLTYFLISTEVTFIKDLIEKSFIKFQLGGKKND